MRNIEIVDAGFIDEGVAEIQERHKARGEVVWHIRVLDTGSLVHSPNNGDSDEVVVAFQQMDSKALVYSYGKPDNYKSADIIGLSKLPVSY